MWVDHFTTNTGGNGKQWFVTGWRFKTEKGAKRFRMAFIIFVILSVVSTLVLIGLRIHDWHIATRVFFDHICIFANELLVSRR